MKKDKLMITFKFQSKDENDTNCNWDTFSIDKISASSIEKALKIIDNIKDMNNIDDAMVTMSGSYEYFRPMLEEILEEMLEEMLEDANKSSRWREEDQNEISKGIISTVVEDVLNEFEFKYKNDKEIIRNDLRDYLAANPMYTKDLTSLVYKLIYEDNVLEMKEMNKTVFCKVCTSYPVYHNLKSLIKKKASELYDSLLNEEREKNAISERVIETVIDDVFDEFKFENEDNKKLIRHGLKDYLTANPMYVNALTSLMHGWENGEYSSRLKEIDDDVFFETCASIHAYYDLKASTREKASELYNNLLERRIEDSIRVKVDDFSCSQCGKQLEDIEIYSTNNPRYDKEMFCTERCAIEFCKENDVIKL